MVSGSAVANVATTGNFTIPMMKRLGYPPAFAAAVEAVASTGGQIAPPILGAAAFVMAEILGTSYLTIAVAALLPAIFFYAAVFATVHVVAVQRACGSCRTRNCRPGRRSSPRAGCCRSPPPWAASSSAS